MPQATAWAYAEIPVGLRPTLGKISTLGRLSRASPIKEACFGKGGQTVLRLRQCRSGPLLGGAPNS